MKLDELKEKKLSDLREIAKTLGIEKITSISKDELIEEIMKNNQSENNNKRSENGGAVISEPKEMLTNNEI